MFLLNTIDTNLKLRETDPDIIERYYIIILFTINISLHLIRMRIFIYFNSLILCL